MYLYIRSSIFLLYAGSQAARVVAIAAGSVGGVLFVLLLLVAIIATIVRLVSQKWKVYNLSSSQMVEYFNKPGNEKITTETNVAYMLCIQ